MTFDTDAFCGVSAAGSIDIKGHFFKRSQIILKKKTQVTSKKKTQVILKKKCQES